LWTKVKVAPPSVDFHRPYGCAPGWLVVAPPLTDVTPRTPRADAT
jgi:hypothetical protein